MRKSLVPWLVDRLGLRRSEKGSSATKTTDTTETESATRPADEESIGLSSTTDWSGARDSEASATLDDRERIYDLVESQGGQMWQSDIVQFDNWSKSLVSRRLSELEDVGWVRRVQRGREKAVFTLERE